MANVHPIRAGNYDDEIQIRQAIDSFARAFEAKDLKKILSGYAPEVVAFDLMPPLRVSGLNAWSEVWQKSLSMMNGQITSEMRDLSIDIEGNLAVCHGLSHFTFKGEENIDLWMRWTGGFRRMDGKWLVIHEHLSVPVNMQSGEAVLDLKP